MKLVDNNFSHHSHSRLSCDQQYVDGFSWNRDLSDVVPDDVIVFAESAADMAIRYPGNRKLLWLLEPRVVVPQAYEWAAANYRLFEKVLTYDQSLLEVDPRFTFVPFGGCWIYEADQRIHEKTKLISTISSTKNWTVGHRMRCDAVDRVGHLMDVYGRGRREVGYKLDGLRDYMFHLVVENGRMDHFFSEKLIDCLVTGTVPVYWGCPSIGDFFDVGGMVRFDSVDELPNIVKSLTPELYRSILHHVAENFERAKGFLTSEIYMIKNGII